MSERYLRWTVAGLALIGAGIAGYLTYTHFQGSPPVCLNGSGCEVVQKSPWSKLIGVPVALLGLLTYLSIYASTLVRHPLVKQVGVMLALVALGFNAYLLYIQEHEIGRYCTWCVSNEIVSLILAPVAIAWLLSADDRGRPAAR
jgi:uncharacterized membrane protein